MTAATPSTPPDFSPIVRAAQAANPDIFFISSYPVDSVGVLRSVPALRKLRNANL